MSGALCSTVGIWSGTAAPALITGNFIATYSSSGVGSSSTYIYSKDGTSWTVGSLASGTKNAFGAAYGGTGTPKWVMATGSQNVQTSTDGVAWTDQGNALPSANTWVDVAWSPTLSLFVAVNNDNGANHQAATSPDGITWTQRTTPAGAGSLFDVEWVSRFSKFYAFNGPGSATNEGMYSSDGITWTLITATTPPDNSQRVVDLGAAFGLFGLSGGVDWIRSTDGITFAGIGPPPNYPGDGNTTGARILVGGVVYSIAGNGATASLNKATNSDLTAQWAQVTANVLPGLQGQPRCAVLSPSLGLWALPAGIANATQILTTSDGLNYTIFNPTSAVALNMARIMVAA